MKTIVLYFSGTGNSLYVAKTIALALGSASLIPIAKAREGIDFSEVERIGFVYPVYMWGMPRIVAECVRSLAIPEHTEIFAVATYGGSCGNAVSQCADILNKKGRKLTYGFGMRMTANYTPLYNISSQKRQEKLNAKVPKRIEKNLAAMLNGEKKYPKALFFMRLPLKWFYASTMKRIHEMDAKFWVDEKCNGCGICEKVCPVKNIQLRDRRPTWLHHCEHCLRCLHLCPRHALQWGKRTQKRKQYHHPSTTLNDFMG